MSERAGGPRRTVVLALLGIVLVACTLRTAVTSLPPLLDRIVVDFPVDTMTLSLIGATPPIAFALFGLLAPSLARRLGVEPTLIIALGVIAVGHVLRGLAVDSLSLIGATVLTFAGVGVANVLVPPLIKQYFPNRINAFSALVGLIYGLSTAVAAILTPAVAGPVGWRVALAGWAGIVLIAMIPWALLLRSGRVTRAEDPAKEGSGPDEGERGHLYRSPTAWSVALTFGTSAMIMFTLVVWLPSLLHDLAGIPFAEGGAALALFALTSAPINLMIMLIGSRPRLEPLYTTVGYLFFAVGLAGLLFAAGSAPILWIVALGFGSAVQQVGAIMIGTRTRTHGATVRLSAFAQSIGFSLGAVGPVMFGGLHELTGSWTIPLALFLASLLAPLACVLVIRRHRFVEDEWLPRSVKSAPGKARSSVPLG